jgi:hypothetical protein
MLDISDKLIALNNNHKKVLVKKLGTDATWTKLTETTIAKMEDLVNIHNDCDCEVTRKSIRSYLCTDLFGLPNTFCLLDSGRLNIKQIKIGLDFKFENLEEN